MAESMPWEIVSAKRNAALFSRKKVLCWGEFTHPGDIMREISADLIRDTVARLAVEACCNLPKSTLAAMRRAREEELSPTGRDVLDQLIELLGSTESKLVLSSRIPNVIMLVGLQGSGKTTAAVKLAYLLKKQGKSPLLAACDVYRPAAIDQLCIVGEKAGVPVFQLGQEKPEVIAKKAYAYAESQLPVG